MTVFEKPGVFGADWERSWARERSEMALSRRSTGLGSLRLEKQRYGICFEYFPDH